MLPKRDNRYKIYFHVSVHVVNFLVIEIDSKLTMKKFEKYFLIRGAIIDLTSHLRLQYEVMETSKCKAHDKRHEHKVSI